jgi:hypothetical protein
MGEIRAAFLKTMNADIQRAFEAKTVERRRLRELPWLEKLEMLDKLRDRQALLRQTRARESKTFDESFPS